MHYKNFVLAGLIAMMPCITYAQGNVSYSSATFPEPNKGWNKILVMKDGNTAYLHFDEDDVMRLRLYDKEHKLVQDKEVKYKNSIKDDLGRKTSVKGIYEIGGNIVLFQSANQGCGLGGYINCVQSLYRVIIDPATATVKGAEKLCEADKVRSYGYNLSDVTTNDIMVTKDPVSDMYAVLVFNGYSEESAERVKLMTYDGDKLVKTAVLNTSSTQDKATHYAGMCMYDRTVFLGTNARNAKNKSMEIPLCMTVLKDGSEPVTQEINLKPFAINSDNQLMYNPGSHTLQMLTTTETEHKATGGFFANGSQVTHYYASGVSMIDPATLELKNVAGIDMSLAQKYAKEVLKDRDGFNGVGPTCYINADNTTTIIPEEQTTITRTGPYGGGYTATLVSKIGLIKINEEAKATESYVLRIRELSPSLMRGTAPSYYFDYKYMNTPNASYILLNDLEENFDKPLDAKPHVMSTISDGNTILYKMANGKVEKSYVFGAPERRKNPNRFVNVGSSVYDDATHTWIGIVVNGDNKDANLAWVTLD